jgi:uroporphyrinogen-III synthase
LSTRPIDEDQIITAQELGIDIDCISFIETTAIENPDLTLKINRLLSSEAAVVFTSMNAIEVVVTHLTTKPNWSIYCMGVTSKKLINQYFGPTAVLGTANSSSELAELILAENKADQINFFCGDQRRDELPNILNNNGIRVNEIKVYHTTEIKQTITKFYDAVLFFSPSAVSSFFNSNQLAPTTIVFAIGKTTATTLEKRTKNKMIVADVPGKRNLVKKMMEYFLSFKKGSNH